MKLQAAEKKKKERAEAAGRFYLYMCFTSLFTDTDFYNYSDYTGVFIIINECNFSWIKQ